MGSVGSSNKSIITQTLYHGTDASNITEFNSLGKESNGAIFFADDIDYAEEEAYEKNLRSGNGGYIYEVNLDIRNPLYVTLSTNDFGDPVKERKYIEQAKKEGKDSVIFTNDTDDDLMKQTFYAVFNKNQVTIKNKRKV